MRQSADGGGTAEPFANTLLPDRAHQRSVAARVARLRSTIMDDGRGQKEYIRQVLEAYRKTPGTMGNVRRADRMLAAQLYQRGLSVTVIENALVLAATVGSPFGTTRWHALGADDGKPTRTHSSTLHPAST